MAALTLLERETPAGHLAERTAHFAAPAVANERDTQSMLIFRVGSEWLALRTAAVQEVTDARPIHTLPHRRAGAVLGIANIRGELLVCVAIGRLLGLARAEEPAQPAGARSERCLVIRAGEIRAVCPADEIHGIHRFCPQELRALPSTVARAKTTYSKAVADWNGRSIGVLDDEMLFDAVRRSLA
jgi:chemotaxis-related protein WspD